MPRLCALLLLAGIGVAALTRRGDRPALARTLPRSAYLHLLTDAEFEALREATAAGQLH